MSFDFTEFKEYAKKIERMQMEWDVFIKKFMLDMGLRALRGVKLNTPTDTGLLRNMWQIGNGRNVIKAVKGMKVSAAIYTSDLSRSKSATVESVVRNGDMLEISIHNPVVYASYVELGHMDRSRTHWIEGKFMLTRAINDIEKLIPNRFKGAFDLWIRSL